jgi:hypothetical protein
MLKKQKLVSALLALAFAPLVVSMLHAQAGAAPDVAKVIKAAADAMGMPRTGGPGGAGLPEVDIINRMEFWGSGTVPGANGAAATKGDYHAALGYNPPAMRVEVTRTGAHTIETVRDTYAWNESQVGAGLEPGRGTATPVTNAVKGRLLQVWILPYGVVKAAFAAGDQTKLSTENGANVLTFPLSGELTGITVKATLDAKNFITKVETQTDNPALNNLVREADYSDYADHGDILTDIKSPGHVTIKRGGNTVLDVQIKKWDANNPYLVFPVPQNVRNAAGQESSKVAEK